ncbi:DoxX family protein [Mucilaginibacter sp. FT3.2]|uniref:DoxX family protein n=1 Tax=Mucilaginibacter sp. FT3.2 TaxID=2723090 RepID=UPI00161DFC9C|nr:DoxX family protein [Mucilaginibacter sp. FT3.2]MBB6234086.1 putative membrane protein YphA (DoxX/SURF4 family) [Mucilaginibacter sp. FT3.2]
MKAFKITYWITTSIIALMMTYSAVAYLTKPEMTQAFHHLGFPDYFRVELAVAKVIGAILLLIPVSSKVKEWAYAGFFIVFVSAFIAHTASGDPVAVRVAPVVFLAILGVSYVSGGKKNGVIATK